jgi:predicted RNase H-like HicB family nuclease
VLIYQGDIIWRTKFLRFFREAYENQWVALSPDYTTVMASGETLEEADANVPEGDRAQVVFHKVLPFDALYIPTVV